MRVGTLLPVVVTFALLLAACSGSGDESNSSGSEAARAEPAESVVEPEPTESEQGIVVPDLTDTPIIEAFESLRALGLRVAISDEYSIGRLWQPEPATMTPEPGELVDAGTVVTLQPGGAPFRFPDDVPNIDETVQMPDLVGMNLRDAIEELEDLNLFWLVRETPPLPASEADHLFDEYRVIRQTPDPGFELSVGLLADDPDTVILFPELESSS